MASYTFQPLDSDDNAESVAVGSARMGGDLLLHDARWFTGIRWVVVVVLFGIGVFGLQQADEDKNRQMLRVTHDLKAPFSGIESSIQVLKHVHWDLLPEGAQKIITKIEVRSETLRSRIGEILTLGSLRSGHVSGKSASPTDLRELLVDVVEELRGLATQKQVMVSLEAEAVAVHSDPRQLKILFMNLISNAITYSQEGGIVEIACGYGKQGVVEIRDHGIGIKQEALPHIFEDFYRSKEAAKFNPKSTGLGLATVRQVADNLGLAIQVESEDGAGTLFRVRIPVATGATGPRPHGVLPNSERSLRRDASVSSA